MKRFLFLFLVILNTIVVNAQTKYSVKEIQSRFAEMKQNFKDDNGEWVFEKIIEIDASSEDIFKAAIEAISNTYRGENCVIESANKEQGRIIAEAIIASEVRPYNMLMYIRNEMAQNIKIDIKEKRYRMTIKFNKLSYQIDDKAVLLYAPVKAVAGHELTKYYPYQPKVEQKSKSFENLLAAYNITMGKMDEIQKRINELLVKDEW